MFFITIWYTICENKENKIANIFLKDLAAAVTCDPLTPERYSINLKNIIMLLNCSKVNASKAH